MWTRNTFIIVMLVFILVTLVKWIGSPYQVPDDVQLHSASLNTVAFENNAVQATSPLPAGFAQTSVVVPLPSLQIEFQELQSFEPESGMYLMCLDKFVLRLARESPDRAFFYLSQLRSSQGNAVSLFFTELDQLNPLLARLLLGEFRDLFYSRAFNVVVQTWGKEHPLDAFRSVSYNLKEEDRAPALHSLARVWGDSNPREALNWAQSNFQGALKEDLMVNIFSLWAQKDPESAIASSSILTDPSARTAALEQVVVSWVTSAPLLAANWVAGQPDEQVFSSFAASWLHSDSEAALKWIASVHGPQRANAFRTTAAVLKELDSDKVRLWAASLNGTDRQLVNTALGW